MPNVNPDILRWARETAGLSPEVAAKKLGINDARGIDAAARLLALESGEVAPTRPMLAKMAKHYRRPLLVFYMKNIPPRGDLGEDFRTLPESVDLIQEGIVDAVVRDISARQSLVRGSLESADQAEPLPFIGSMRRQDGVKAVVDSIRTTLNFNLEAFRSEPGPRSAFAYLRSCVETSGVFVILVDNLGSWLTTIGVNAFRGFALADDVAPFVAINANDSPGAWSFTLLHEIAHLWIGKSGLSGGTAKRGVEKFCEDIAAEFLLPRAEAANLGISETSPFEVDAARIAEFARSRNVGNTMVAYMLYRNGAFNFDRFQEFKGAYRKAILARKDASKNRNADKDGGSDNYSVRKHRVGIPLIRLVDQLIHEGILSVTKAGMVLGVRAQNVHALLESGRPNHSILVKRHLFSPG